MVLFLFVVFLWNTEWKLIHFKQAHVEIGDIHCGYAVKTAPTSCEAHLKIHTTATQQKAILSSILDYQHQENFGPRGSFPAKLHSQQKLILKQVTDCGEIQTLSQWPSCYLWAQT